MGKILSLFSTYNLLASLEGQRRTVLGLIDVVGTDEILDSTLEDWCAYFLNKNIVEVPKLLEDRINVESSDAKIEEYGPRMRWVDGARYIFHVPFEGEANMFQMQPSTFTLSPPHAELYNGELLFAYHFVEHDATQVRELFQRNLTEVKRYLGNQESDVKQHNDMLQGLVMEHLKKRRERALKTRGITESLGYPLRARAGESLTFQAPVTRKRIVISPPQARSVPYAPEPTLGMEQYEQILSVSANMVQVMERSPKSFKNMKEPALRDHILVQLNGQFEGQATSETFNGDGKTDILIRVNDKNIFIAECKIWRGEESLFEAIDQLLGYTTWRDTKTAIFVFNRNKDLTKVLNIIREKVSSHSCFKRHCEFKSETGFRFVFRNKDDANRELILTIIVFNVPVSE